MCEFSEGSPRILCTVPFKLPVIESSPLSCNYGSPVVLVDVLKMKVDAITYYGITKGAIKPPRNPTTGMFVLLCFHVFMVHWGLVR